jgi:hypothetical protein
MTTGSRAGDQEAEMRLVATEYLSLDGGSPRVSSSSNTDRSRKPRSVLAPTPPRGVESQPMPSPAEIPVSEHLRKVPAVVRPTVQAARRTVKAVAPQAREITYQSQPPRSSRAMWKLVRYAVEGENVVGIGTFPKHATLYFYRGRELDDGSGLLAGSGKDMRFITLQAPDDAERPAVKQVVRKAFKLGRVATRGAKN